MIVNFTTLQNKTVFHKEQFLWMWQECERRHSFHPNIILHHLQNGDRHEYSVKLKKKKNPEPGSVMFKLKS